MNESKLRGTSSRDLKVVFIFFIWRELFLY